MKTRIKMVFFSLAIAISIALSIGVYAQNGGVMHASAVLKDADGKEVGFARFTEDADGIVHVSVRVKDLPPGLHGIHIHDKGSCSPNFTAAGSHYNPLGKQHGLNNPKGPHAGDLPNLEVNKDGTGYLNTTTSNMTLSQSPTTVFDKDGSALIIHTSPDDQVTDPTGNSGDRIACGVIETQ